MGLVRFRETTIVRCLSRLVELRLVILSWWSKSSKNQKRLIEIRRHKMGMVFQSFGLMPHLNVIDNIAFPLKLQGIQQTECYKQANGLLIGWLKRSWNEFPEWTLRWTTTACWYCSLTCRRTWYLVTWWTFFCSGPIDPEKYAEWIS